MVRRYSGSYLECLVTKNRAIELHCNFAYSALASFRMGMSGRPESMAIKDLGLSKVLHQHDVRVFELVLTVEKRSAVRGDSQASVE